MLDKFLYFYLYIFLLYSPIPIQTTSINNTLLYESKINLRSLYDPLAGINDDKFVEKYNQPITEVTKDKNCVSKKMIILNVNGSGMCNRILALYSTIFLSIILDRVLILNWQPNMKCGIGFEEVFAPNSPSKFTPQPFIYKNHIPKDNMIKTDSSRCVVIMNEIDWSNFQFIKNEYLLKKLDENCDVIDLHSNINYLDLVLSTNLAKKMLLSQKFPFPFSELGATVFRLNPLFEEKAKNFVQIHFAGKKWVSIHARSIHTKMKEFERALNLANTMIADDLVSYVFLATDSYELDQRAHEILKNKVVTMVKDFDKENQFGHEGFHTRDHKGMKNAVVEWTIVGYATYCMSTSFYRSTFSKTSIGKSECKFIDYKFTKEGKDYPINFGIEKKHNELVNKGITEKIMNLPEIDQEEADKLWENIKKVKMHLSQQCYPKDTILDNVMKYWELGD